MLRSCYPLTGGGLLHRDRRSSLATRAGRSPGSSVLRKPQVQPDLYIFATGRENLITAGKEKRRMSRAAQKGRVRADNCCKTQNPLLLHARAVRAGKESVLNISDDVSDKFKHSDADKWGKELPLLVWKPLPVRSASKQERGLVTGHNYSITWQLWKQANPSHSAASSLLVCAVWSCHPSKHGVVE